MKRRPLSHLSNGQLKVALHRVVREANVATAVVLDHIAEFAARRLYAEAGYSSMIAYCIGELNFSEQAAYKRMFAAWAARRFPLIRESVADGRLHLTAVVLLKRHLTAENVGELLAAASRQPGRAIERMLAIRFPKQDVPSRVEAVPAAVAAEPNGLELSARKVPSDQAPEMAALSPGKVASDPEPGPTQLSARKVEAPVTFPKVAPLSAQSYAIQFTMSQALHDKLRYAQNLLGHAVAPSDLAQVFERALDALIPQLEKKRFAATDKPRPPRPASEGSRHIPAFVQRAVWARDGGQCTFKSAVGHRCEERSDLEFDHIVPVARGGRSTVDNIRLLCAAHNLLEAERAYGVNFMESKRRAS
jgi:hypothetical protein